MGQFNYAKNDTTREVVFWAQKWRRWFHTVVAAGPFHPPTMQQLQQNSILALVGANDGGFYSPLENFARTLKQYSNKTGIDGVLYLHDDAFLNMRKLYPSLVDGTDVLVTHRLAPGPIFTIQNDDQYKFYDGTLVRTEGEAVAFLMNDKRHSWPHWNKCIGPLSRFRKDPRSSRYRESDGSLLVNGDGNELAQTDFMFVPTKYTSVIEPAAMMMSQYRVFLECGGPKLTDILRRTANATIREISLCTSWDYGGARGQLAMLHKCGFSKAMSHPFKIHEHGLRVWSRTFDDFVNNDKEFDSAGDVISRPIGLCEPIQTSAQCTAEEVNLGEFNSPHGCAEAIANQPFCGDLFMFSATYPGWGCRCCSIGVRHNNTGNDNWDLFSSAKCNRKGA